jgi:peroxiredoxin
MRLREGKAAIPFTAEDVLGHPQSLAHYAGQPVLLQFYRYAGCPMCDLRLHDFAREYPRLAARGINVIAFFHSGGESVRKHLQDRGLPFAVVADPTMAVYRAYGVESSLLRLFLSSALPSFYADWFRAMRHGYWGSVHWRMTTMPADFLLGPDHVIQRVHYGSDIGDHMSVDAILRTLSQL